MKKISIVFLLMIWAFTMYAQDVITLRNGSQIQAKVTEISSSEIKYKRFDHLDGPTIVVARSDVHAIAFANGIHEVFNPLAEPAPPARPTATAPATKPANVPATAPATAPATNPPPAKVVADTPPPAPVVNDAPPPARMAPTNEIRGPHRKNFYTGFYFNPVSIVVLNGASLGAEFTFGRKFIVEPYFRFPRTSVYFLVEEVIDNGLGFGIATKFFTGGRRGGFYVGPNVEYNLVDDFQDIFLFLGCNLGYKFQFSSGFYLRTGASLGTQINIGYDTLPWLNLDLCFGFSF